MKNWYAKFLLLGLLALTPPAAAEPRDPNLAIAEFEQALAHWDMVAAREAADEIAKESPDAELNNYLKGTLLFYDGEYAEAASTYSKVKHLKKFENSEEGFSKIAAKILKEKFKFKS